MWIRSQDKEKLIKANNMLFIREIVNAGYAIAYDLYNNDEFINLGIYKSKEKAIEVLDDISKQLSMNKAIEICSNLGDMTQANRENYIYSLVYQMPEE